MPVLAAAVGIYLPLDLSMAVFLGSAVAWLVERTHGAPHDETELNRMHQKGTLFAAGLITGEALMGILIAIPIVMQGKADVLALPASWQFGEWLGLVVIGFVAWLLYRSGARRA
jgi:uncharacterized oligopeptide transporter (OPT) family protein